MLQAAAEVSAICPPVMSCRALPRLAPPFLDWAGQFVGAGSNVSRRLLHSKYWSHRFTNRKHTMNDIMWIQAKSLCSPA
jgi:hypothetical protein